MRKVAVLFFVLIVFMVTAAYAQTLPSVNCISPGLQKWMNGAKSGVVTERAAVSVDELFYIPDISVLQNILSGITFQNDSVSEGEGSRNRLTLESGGEQLCSLLWAVDGEYFSVSEGEETYRYPLAHLPFVGSEDANSTLNTLKSLFPGGSLIERVDMVSLKSALQNGTLISMIPGLTQKKMDIAETHSDDGLRLTKLDFSGSFTDAANANWSISGKVFKPGGNSPKDVAEIQLLKDDSTQLKLVMSGTYKTETVKKEQKGTVTGNVRVNIDGKWNGYRVTYILGLRVRNDWQADGEALSEKLTITPTLNWTDKTPGRRYMHLNTGEITVKDILQVSTLEERDTADSISEKITLSVIMDANTTLAGALNVVSEIKDRKVPTLPDKIQDADAGKLMEMGNQLAKEISGKVYKSLGENARKKISQGL